jgi:hypothetical protein
LDSRFESPFLYLKRPELSNRLGNAVRGYEREGDIKAMFIALSRLTFTAQGKIATVLPVAFTAAYSKGFFCRLPQRRNSSSYFPWRNHPQ